MNRKTAGLILMVASTVIFIALMWLILHAPAPKVQRVDYQLPREQSPAFHGADALEICPDGSMTAFEWVGSKYRVMWVRRGRL